MKKHALIVLLVLGLALVLVGAVYAAPAVPGCTDPEATNYNPEATVDNHSCEYASIGDDDDDDDDLVGDDDDDDDLVGDDDDDDIFQDDDDDDIFQDDDDDDDDGGTQTITAKALIDHECDASEWHFVITQIEEESLAPATIFVQWGNGNSENVPLDKFTGKTAHYTTYSNLDSPVISAEAEIYGDWGGQFNLSHGPCDPGDDDDDDIGDDDDDDDIGDDDDDDDDVGDDDDDDDVGDDDDDDDVGDDDDDDGGTASVEELVLPLLGPVEAVAPAAGGISPSPVTFGAIGLGLLGLLRLAWALIKR